MKKKPTLTQDQRMNINQLENNTRERVRYLSLPQYSIRSSDHQSLEETLLHPHTTPTSSPLEALASSHSPRVKMPVKNSFTIFVNHITHTRSLAPEERKRGGGGGEGVKMGDFMSKWRKRDDWKDDNYSFLYISISSHFYYSHYCQYSHFCQKYFYIHFGNANPAGNISEKNNNRIFGQTHSG